MATSSRMFEPLAGATVDGSLLFGSDTANYFDPATTSFQTGESLVPLGFGNSATPCLQGLPCSSKVAVRNDWTEFAFSSEGDVLIKRVDLTTSGLLTLTDTTAGIGINAKYTVTLRSSAFTAFQDVLSVISDGFMPGWVVTATLAGDTLTIQVPDRDLLDAGDLGTVTYTIRLGPPQVLKSSNHSRLRAHIFGWHAGCAVADRRAPPTHVTAAVKVAQAPLATRGNGTCLQPHMCCWLYA